MSSSQMLDTSSRGLWSRVRAAWPALKADEKRTIYEEMHENSRANIDFYVLILLSSLIAYFGLIEDSEAVIIGAMLVAPLMSPMMAMAYSVLVGNGRMLRNALVSTLAGIALVVGLSALVTMVLPSSEQFLGSQIEGRTNPSLLDLAIALASGAAGAYAMSRKQVGAALPGVAIAAALVPPLCVVGLGVGMADWTIAGGALLLFLTNLASVLFAGSVVFLALGLGPAQAEQAHQMRRRVLVTVIGVFVVAIPLTVSSLHITRLRTYQAQVERILRGFHEAEVAEVGAISVRDDEDGYAVSFTTYIYDPDSFPDVLRQVEERIVEAAKVPVTIQARTVQSSLSRYGSDLFEAAPRP